MASNRGWFLASAQAYVGQRMDAYKEERYSGLEGKGRWIKDKLLGMPAEVNAFYTEGKRRYLGAMDAVVDGVATLVETGLREATAEVSLGKREVDTYVKSLPASLQKIGKEAQSQVQARFDELSQSITDKQSALVDSLAQKWSEETQKLGARLEQLKAANRGFVDKALDAMGDVISTIKQLGEMLRSVLARAAGVVDKILRDPIGFVGNLVAGAKAGFQRFVSNVEQHLQQGLIGWLTGALGTAGIQLPEKFDLKGIFSLVVQVLGLTWQSVRPRAVRLLGEKAVAALEEASEVVKALVTGGFGTVWEHIKEAVGDLKAAVLDQIKSFVVTKVITAGVTWILSLLNPASAFIKACKAIYDIVMFFVERAAQISDLVGAVLDSIEAVVGGAIGAMASKIEGALAKALPVAIGFLASLLGIGGISEKVKAVIQKVKVPIEKAIDWVLQKAVAFAKKAGRWVKAKATRGKKADATGREAKEDNRTEAQKLADLAAAVAEADQAEEANGASAQSVREKFPAIQSKYRLTSIRLVEETADRVHVEAIINPKKSGKPKVFKPGNFFKGDLIQLRSGQKWLSPPAVVDSVGEAGVQYMHETGSGVLSGAGMGRIWRKYNPAHGYKTGAAFEAIRNLSVWDVYNPDARQTLNYRYHHDFNNPSGKQWHHIHEQNAGGPNSVTNLAQPFQGAFSGPSPSS